MKKISSKKWILSVLTIIVIIFIGCISLVIIIDPYLHYRLPDNGLSYSLTTQNQRYQNDGIIKFFDYDAMITGTSMTENFKTSEFDKLFHMKSIKIPFSGGSYREVNNTCKRALEINPDVKAVVRSIDLSMLVCEKDSMRYSNYPEYLYNNNLIDDVNYWLNKMTILEGCMQNVIFHSLVAGTEQSFLNSFSFDEYSNWQDEHTFGKESVLASYMRPDEKDNIVEVTDQDKQMIRDNVAQNITELTCAYPDTTFYFFLTPYSICYWDSLDREGKVKWEVEAQRVAIEEMLKCDNIELYSFCNNFEMVCNLNNYKDVGHYSENINSQILVWMKNGDYKLTEENYEDYLKEIYYFYSSYDYESIFTNS